MAVTLEPRGTQCPCGKRKTVNVVVEFIKDGKFDYAGSRLCYDHGTEIHYAIPEGADLTEVRIYDWREPEEMIRITASPIPEAPEVAA
jgi:hypothetical protein